MKYPKITVDVIVVKNNHVALIRRKNSPFSKFWAIPGGFVNYGETVEQAAKREIKEEAGLVVDLEHLLGVFSDPSRDPRGHIISICFVGKYSGGKLTYGSDACDCRWFHRNDLPKDLAFDHGKILKKFFEWKDKNES
jgi:8-oxo-dGTP diphosphatase